MKVCKARENWDNVVNLPFFLLLKIGLMAIPNTIENNDTQQQVHEATVRTRTEIKVDNRKGHDDTRKK